MARRGFRLAAAGAALGATLTAHARLPASAGPSSEGAPSVARADLARVAALGFDALLADYYWLEAVQLVGGAEANPARHAASIGRLIDVVTALDPWVDHPYRFAALWMSETPALVHDVNRVLERGVAYHPGDWRNRFYLSFNHFFYVGDTAAAARELVPALALPGAPPWLRRLLARLRSETDGLEAAAAYLHELLRHTEDGYHRATYEKALDEIETERRARVLDEARERFRARHARDPARVEELVQGSEPVLEALPPEPHGWEWVVSGPDAPIVSSYYGRRYQVHFQDPAEAPRPARAARAEAMP